MRRVRASLCPVGGCAVIHPNLRFIYFVFSPSLPPSLPPPLPQVSRDPPLRRAGPCGSAILLSACLPFIPSSLPAHEPQWFHPDSGGAREGEWGEGRGRRTTSLHQVLAVPGTHVGGLLNIDGLFNVPRVYAIVASASPFPAAL